MKPIVPPPFISIILPVYNREHYVSTAIESVLAQTYPHFELIVIDDGSTDNSKAMIEPFLSDSRIHYYYQDNSGKPSIARNQGIKLASGQWLAFIDSDDRWIYDKLARQVALIEECQSLGENLDLVLGDYQVFDCGHLAHSSFFQAYGVWKLLNILPENHRQHGYVFSRIQLLKALYRRGFAATQAVLVRRQMVRKLGGFNDELTFAEDNDLWMTIAEQGAVGLVQGPVHEYHLHGANITSGVNPLFYTDTISVLNAHLQQAKQLPMATLPLRQRLGFYQLGFAQQCLLNGDIRQGLRLMGYAMPYLTCSSNIRIFLRCLKAVVTRLSHKSN